MRSDARGRLLAGALILAGTAVRLWVATGPGYLGQDGDLYEWRLATHRAISEGLHTVYERNRRNDPALTGRAWTGDYFFNMPPVLLYLRIVPALAYRAVDRSGFELWDSGLNFHALEAGDLPERLARSRWFTVALKLPGIVADALIALALYLSSSAFGPSARLAAVACYTLNPAIVYNSAFWGQGDPVWIALVAASFFLLARGRPAAAATAYTLAALTKPQALAFAPLLAALLARRGSRTLAGPALAAGATFLVVFLPFILRGSFVETVGTIWRSTFGGEPYLSCGAANLWFLVDGGRIFGTSDTIRMLGPLTARGLGLLAFLAGAVAIARRAPVRDAGGLAWLFLAAAVTSLAFFAFSTELHENHLIAVLAFLGFAAPADARLWWIFGALSLTIQANLLVFDEFAMARVQPLLGWWSGRPLAVAVALVQTAALPIACGLFFPKRRANP